MWKQDTWAHTVYVPAFMTHKLEYYNMKCDFKHIYVAIWKRKVSKADAFKYTAFSITEIWPAVWQGIMVVLTWLACCLIPGHTILCIATYTWIIFYVLLTTNNSTYMTTNSFRQLQAIVSLPIAIANVYEIRMRMQCNWLWPHTYICSSLIR